MLLVGFGLQGVILAVIPGPGIIEDRGEISLVCEKDGG